MLTNLHAKKKVQLLLGFLAGIVFGFLLHRGGVSRYDVIMGQLLLTDFTVMKIMLSAVITGMIGIYAMNARGWVAFHRSPGSVGMNVAGGLLFGVGFAVLGYCPGTLLAATGNGFLDAISGGVGILIGAGLFAAAYPFLGKTILQKGYYGNVSLPELLNVNSWVFIIPFIGALVALLWWVESAGL